MQVEVGDLWRIKSVYQVRGTLDGLANTPSIKLGNDIVTLVLKNKVRFLNAGIVYKVLTARGTFFLHESWFQYANGTLITRSKV